jgi:ribosomal protein L20
LAELFSPLARHILRKNQALQKVYTDKLKHAELVKELLDCTDFEMERRIIAEMEKLEVSDGWLAFAEKIDQHAYIQAASFSDTWTRIRDALGNVTWGVNSWYICQALTGPWDYELNKPSRCLRITESKLWDRLHKDALAKGQRYYCSCYAKYNATWGQIVETTNYNLLTQKVEKTYMRSDVPSWDCEDIRAMDLEDTLAPEATAHDLFAMVQSCKPALCDVIVEDAQGHHKIVGGEVYDSLGKFEWKTLHQMTQKGKKSKK